VYKISTANLMQVNSHYPCEKSLVERLFF